jgi:ribonucleoside-diphosphate reductase alpha chain
MKSLEDLKKDGEAAEWLTEEGLRVLQNGYLLPNETPKDMYKRVAGAAAKRLKRPDLEKDFFDIIWKNWLCLATPVASNMGTDRGLPISCNSIHVGDSINSIFKKSHELAVLSKYGAGVGIYMGDIRGRGSKIKGNGKSEGIVPWAKVYDSVTLSVSQGSVRRGAAALYLPIEHLDSEEFINLRRPVGDINRRCMNINHAVCLSDEFMSDVDAKKDSVKGVWKELLRARFETGEPYFMFNDKVNAQAPETYKKLGLKIKTSNICNEIFLYTDEDHTFVCCLSSLNLARWEEWKDSDVVEKSIYFLDAVMEEYIEKASQIEGFESAVRFAKKSRALGLGALGWHTLLQQKMISFDSFDAMMLNGLIFRTIREKADAATLKLGAEYGEPEWCKGSGRRNTHTMAVAPTVSNSLISGGISQGIEPIVSNVYAQKSAKGTFIRKSTTLKSHLELLGRDTLEVWASIDAQGGSVQHLDFLSPEAKEVFMTAYELNQFAIINQAAQRQRWIDQGQSVNLFFPKNSDPKYINDVHVEAWRKDMKGLYYCRSESVLKGDNVFRQKDECKACEG